MGIIIFLVIWYFFVGRNRPKTFEKVKKNKRKWLPLLIILFLFSVVGGTDIFAFTIALGVLIAPFYLIFRFLRMIFSPKNSPKQQTTRYERNQAIPKAEQLPSAVPKRIRIVEKFNRQYELNLTSGQIQTIVDASYISTDWELFLSSLTKEYATVHQWFKTPANSWLRVYLRVFNAQTISPDMAQQKQICIDSFQQIFQYADLSSYNTPAWDIRDINNKFMTNFDDITFMLAYRFLESNGIKYPLGKVKILSADDELEQLKEKYAHQTF